MTLSPYDPAVLRNRASLWRVEAAVATREAMRLFCLSQADECEQLVQRSLSTPILRESGTGDAGPRPNLRLIFP